MTRTARKLANRRGYTLIELMATVMIMGIIASIAMAGYETLQARIRFAQIKADMDAIVHAAYNDFTSSPTNDWAAMVMPGDPPSFVPKELEAWPIAPCPGWFYSWDNFYGVPSVKSVRITLRREDFSSIWSFCLESYGGDCQGDDGFGGSPPEISTIPNKHAYCNE